MCVWEYARWPSVELARKAPQPCPDGAAANRQLLPLPPVSPQTNALLWSWHSDGWMSVLTMMMMLILLLVSMQTMIVYVEVLTSSWLLVAIVVLQQQQQQQQQSRLLLQLLAVTKTSLHFLHCIYLPILFILKVECKATAGMQKNQPNGGSSFPSTVSVCTSEPNTTAIVPCRIVHELKPK